jgi:hypothetical protein
MGSVLLLEAWESVLRFVPLFESRNFLFNIIIGLRGSPWDLLNFLLNRRDGFPLANNMSMLRAFDSIVTPFSISVFEDHTSLGFRLTLFYFE